MIKSYKQVLLGALSLLALPAMAQDCGGGSEGKKPSPWSLSLQGGIGFASGVDYQSVNPQYAKVAPSVGAQVHYSLSRLGRLGIDYLYSSYSREQRYSSVSLDADGRAHLYGNQKVKYHRFGFSAECNLAEGLCHDRKSHWLNVYLGTGVGAYMSYGSEYSIDAMEGGKVIVDGKEYPITGDLTFTDVKNLVVSSSGSLKSTNKNLDANCVYIPLSLSFEADVDRHVTLGVKGEIDYLVGKKDFMPSHTDHVLVTLGYKF